MCGIAGLLSIRRTNRSKIEQAVKTISHRGPDEYGFFLGEKCNLGIARLAIIDVTDGHQPCFNEDNDIVSVFNGEIYNYKELRDLLIKRGHRLTTNSDSEIIPHLFEEFGEKFPKELQGMFAIAIYVKSKNAIYLIRDRLGKKPLWYAIQDGNFYFSSEIKGLFPLGVRRIFQDSVLAEYLAVGYINAPRSAFKDVNQVIPGTSLKFQDGQISNQQYWCLDEVKETAIAWGDALDHAEYLIRQSIKERLVSERPLGVFLSGGIDSSLVAAVAKQELGELKSFSIGFMDPKFDESNYASSIASYLGTEHHTRIIRPNPSFIVEELSKVLDQPFADDSIIPTFLLSKFANEQVVVALSGDGGDEVFAGYDRYRANFYLSFFDSILRVSPLLKIFERVASESRRSKLLRAVACREEFKRYKHFVSNVPSYTLGNLLSKPYKYPQGYEDLELEQKVSGSRLRAMQLLDMKTYLPGDLLYKADIASMANGLEVRSPLLDYRVVEFGVSLPQNFKIGLFNNKLILRELLKRFVPVELFNRPKKGFAIPRANWLRAELRPLVTDTLISKDAWVNNQLDREEIKRLIQRHMKGRNHEATIWSLLMLELWAKQWLVD
jgi:asparagine synthase (glutamine-hydrolysing)